jgi:hypothetical protein
MNANEIDRALREDRTVTPSPDFAARVTIAVRHQAGEHEGLAFPWRRLLPGLVACTAVAVAAVILGGAPEIPAAVTRVMQDAAVVHAATWIPMSLLGSWMLVWTSLRLAGHRR